MKLKKPKFWDFKKPNIISYILAPLTILIRLNNFFLEKKQKKKYLKIKSICIGNIYVGGTGKTPTVIKLDELLKKINIKVCTAKKIYPNQRDEEIILKKKSNLILDVNRTKIIQKAIKENYEVVIFDDGLQDNQIDYDVKFVCFDSQSWIGNGCLIPSGPLREKIDSLKRYDAVILKCLDRKFNFENIYKTINEINPKIRIFNSFLCIENKNEFSLNDKYLIFSGIGNNNSFKNILVNNDFNIAEEFFFPDHYNYKNVDVEKLLKISEIKNIKIITTEKDFVKIPDVYKSRINFIKINLEIFQQEKLIKFIRSKINEKN